MSTTHAYVIFFSGLSLWISAMVGFYCTWRLNKATLELARACTESLQTVERVLNHRAAG